MLRGAHKVVETARINRIQSSIVSTGRVLSVTRGISIRKSECGVNKVTGSNSIITTQTYHTTNAVQPTFGVRFFADLPAHAKLGLPALSPTMETGNLAKWRKKEGDSIKPGEIIAEVETDKATVDFEATEEGYLAKILIPEGTKDLTVGKTIAIVVEKQEDIGAFANYKGEEGGAPAPKPKAAEQPAPKQAAPQPSAPAQAAPSQPRASTENVVPGAPPTVPGAPPKSGVFASPLAKALAGQAGVNLSGVAGSGPNGRVLGTDVVGAASQQSAAAPQQASGESYVDIPNSNIRRITAKRLTESKQQIPHYYLTIECKVDELLKLRTQLNDKANGAFKLSVNDFVVKASALALRKVPAANSSWHEDSIRRYNMVDINVAVNTDKGLFTPLIKDADKVGLAHIANSVKDLAEKAKANKLNPTQLAAGTFTISNLGMFGIKHFAAVINPPQACILAVGGAEKRVIVNENDKANPYTTATFMSVTLSCDHRVVDGAIGAEWLKAFKEYIEDPVKMLL